MSKTVRIYDILSSDNTTSSTTSTTGALTLLNGGVGIGGTTDAVSAISGGSLTTAGGAAIGKNLFTGRNAFFNESGSATTLPIVHISPSSSGLEASIGFYQNVGSTGARWSLGHNVGDKGTDTYGLFSSTLNNSVYTVYNTGQFKINTNLPSTSELTGALVTVGGAGIGGNICTTGNINLTNENSGMITLSGAAKAPPSFTTHSLGTKLMLLPTITDTATNYALGLDVDTFWFSVPDNVANYTFRWYAGTSSIMELVGGRLTAAGDIIAFGNISDERLKTNIRTITPSKALETVVQLNPIEFEWKRDIFNKEKQGKTDSGFSAQEVESLISHAVGESADFDNKENKYKYLNHERIIPYLVGAIKKLNEKITLVQKS